MVRILDGCSSRFRGHTCEGPILPPANQILISSPQSSQTVFLGARRVQQIGGNAGGWRVKDLDLSWRVQSFECLLHVSELKV